MTAPTTDPAVDVPTTSTTWVKPRWGLRLKLTLGLILIIGIVFSGYNTYATLQYYRQSREEALNNISTITFLVAFSLTGFGEPNLHAPIIRSFVENFLSAAITQNKRNQDLVFGVVLDEQDRVIAGRAKPELIDFPDKKRMTDEKQALEKVAKLGGKLGSSMYTKIFTLKFPGQGVVGRLLVGATLARFEQEAKRNLLLNIVAFVVILVLLAAYSRFMLSRLVLRPLNKVVQAMHAVQSGNLMSEVYLRQRDEMGLLANSYNFMVQGLREREHLLDAFNRYVSKQVYDKLQAGEITLTGENRQVTVLFSDIRGFTSLSERLTPQEIVAMLNEYFNEMVEIVFKYEGFLNKFIGDALMAVYNAPLEQSEPELRAVRTGWEMLQALERLNAQREARGQFAIHIGIGVNTGAAIAGNIGHQKRLEYTVIGDAVNLAQRLESQTKVAGATFLISQTTYEAVKAHIEATQLPPVKVKGKQEPVVLYNVVSASV